MQICEINLKNFRSVGDLNINFENVTALMGGNNTGKSTVLKAIEYFFEAAPKFGEDDFHQRNAEEIAIIIKFKNLTPNELEVFGSAVMAGTITIKRVLSKNKDGNLRYEARARSYPPFGNIRAIAQAGERRSAFNALADTIPDLERVSSAPKANDAMNAWELAHPDLLEDGFKRDFFGAPNIANGKLRSKVAVHLVPAVANAAEETADPKKSPIIDLLATISRQTYENKEEVTKFLERARDEFSELTNPEKVPQLSGISKKLTDSLQQYYKDSSLIADWGTEDGLQVQYPRPKIRVSDQGFETAVENVGHGLQRACLFAIIQYLAEHQGANEGEDGFTEAKSDIILLVEEPEIYQHPHKQFVIADAFYKLAEGFSRSTGIRLQIVFTTHSEKFAKLERFHTVRILRRVDNDDSVEHMATGLTLSECSSYFASLVAKPAMSDEAFAAKLHVFSREVCEGFFANEIILVEGPTDKAVLEGYYRALGRDPYSEGLGIIDVGGKTKLDKPLYIFSNLGIPTYCVFDNDQGKSDSGNTYTNSLLQKMLEVENPQDYPSGAFERYCSFDGNLERYVSDVMGAETYEKERDQTCAEFGLQASELAKTPGLVSSIIVKAKAQGKEFQLLDELIAMVDKMRH